MAQPDLGGGAARGISACTTAQQRLEPAGSSSRNRKSSHMIPLEQVKNVRPTRLERRTQTGARITQTCDLH
eukprot:3869066-Pleurochrysis_carterae.AAC.1